MGRVFACSDLHGMLHLWQNIVDTLEPDDTIFVLGDCGDRGPHPWETLKAVLNEPRAILLKGNHEDMLIRVLGDYLEMGCPDYHDLSLLGYNGGTSTYEEAIADPKLSYYYKKLVRLPLLKEYMNTSDERVVLSHAGFTPWKEEFYADDEEKRDTIFHRPKPDDLIWDREHFLDEWTAEDCVDCFIIHGHTPVPYLLDEIDSACTMGEIEPGALWYDKGRKCCIDCGAVFTGYCVLLDLDTWTEDIFCSDPYL